MESEEEELIFFQRNLVGMLKSLSYSCGISHKIFEKLQRQLDNNFDLDVNLIEDSGIKIMNNLKTLRGNMAVVIKYMADEIKEINKNHSETLFDELSMKISLWNTSVVKINEDNEFTFTQLCDKHIMVDESELKNNENTSIENNPILVVDETELRKDSCVSSEPINARNTNDHNCETPNSRTLALEKNEQSINESSMARTSICMSLKAEPNLSDSQNTNDDWNDTLRRDSSISTLNKVHIDYPKEEDVKVEDDNFDEETIHLNQDQDDSFPELQMEPSQSFVLHDEEMKQEDDMEKKSPDKLTHQSEIPSMSLSYLGNTHLDSSKAHSPTSPVENDSQKKKDHNFISAKSQKYADFSDEEDDSHKTQKSIGTEDQTDAESSDKSNINHGENDVHKKKYHNSSNEANINTVSVGDQRENVDDSDKISNAEDADFIDNEFHHNSTKRDLERKRVHACNTRDKEKEDTDNEESIQGRNSYREKNIEDQTRVENSASKETFKKQNESDVGENNESVQIEEINPVNEETCIDHEGTHLHKDQTEVIKPVSNETFINHEKSNSHTNHMDQTEMSPASEEIRRNKGHRYDTDSGDENCDSQKTVTDFDESDTLIKENNASVISEGHKKDIYLSDDETDIHSSDSDSENKKNDSTEDIDSNSQKNANDSDGNASQNKKNNGFDITKDHLKNTDADTSNNSTDRNKQKKKNCNPFSKAQIEEGDSSDDNMYSAPTQKILTKAEGVDSSIVDTVENENLFQKPTQKIAVNRDMSVENTTPSERSMNVHENLHSREADTNNSDRTNDDNQISSEKKANDEAIIDVDETNKKTFDGLFSMESDEEIDKINGLLNEHSYSYASASDLEDSFKEPSVTKNYQEKQVEASKPDGDSNIHNEHNYSSPVVLSEAEAREENEVSASDYDSDETDIDRVVQKEMLEVPDSQDEGSDDENNVDSVEQNELLDDKHAFCSHESTNSYEFDVTENVNHLGAENDDITKRTSSRGSHIIDECESDSSSARLNKIDDSDDKEEASMSKIVNADKVCKPNDTDVKEVHQNTVPEASIESTVEDDVFKELENTLNELDKTEDKNDHEPPQTKEYIEEQTEKAMNKQDDDVIKELENTLKELDKTEYENDDEPPQIKANIEEQTEKAENILNDDVVKELENTLNELNKTRDENDDEPPQSKEDMEEHTEKAKDKQDVAEIAQTSEDDGQNHLEETVSIGSDDDSKEALMDMIMEEILSDTERVREKVDSGETTILTNIKLESDERNVDVGDEILSLLKNLPDQNEDVNPIDVEVEAENVLKMLQESILDESDDDSDISTLTSSDSVEMVEMDDQTSISEDEVARLLKKHNMVDCSVSIEKLRSPQADIEKYQRNLEDNLEWLCDLTNLQKKRKNLSPTPLEQTKRHRKKRKEKSNESSASGFPSDSDVELAGYRSGTPVLPQHLENKLDEILANTICNEVRKEGITSSESSSEDSDDSAAKRKKKSEKGDEVERKESDSDIIFEDNPKSVLSKEEQMKNAWKNDPLLRGRLSSPSGSYESKTSNSKSKKKKNAPTDLSMETEKSDSDSDTDAYKKNKSKFDEKEISPIKRNIPVSDTSDSDSDIEFVSQKMKSPVKVASEEFGISLTQKGRRNIRSLISEDTLAEATKRANKEELERIERLKEREKVFESLSQQSVSMSQNEESEGSPLFLDLDEKTGEPMMKVHEVITAKLKDHQRKGIQFMWDSCYESVKRMKKHDGSGCILAHCMGLGKTFQVLALIHTLFSNEVTNTEHVLVVCPLSTVSNWKKEVKWAFKGLPTIFTVFTIATRKENREKYEIVKKWRHRKNSLLVLGYEGFETLTNESKLDKLDADLKKTMLESLVNPGPDLVICDEGHLLRNKNANKSLALNKIKTKRRIVLTGTPLQNNLNEYYHMVQIVKPNLLGNSKEFKTNFVNPITNGQYEDSTAEDITLMMKRTHVLHRLLAKTVQRIEDSELEIYLPKMVDYAVFIQLTQTQIDLYNYFSDLVKDTRDNNFFGDFQMFQYICTHPQLLAVMDKQRNKRIKERDLITNEDDPSAVCRMEAWWRDKLPEDGEKQIEYGNKMVVVLSILQECEEIGDKVLLFSQCLGELDLIEHFLKTIGTRRCPSWQKKLDYYRMDGTVSPEDRTFICDKFNNPDNARIRLLLMSTKVGGLGLNLTAANRVVIMTVNWNPSYDTQSVFRVYRFGQRKPVYVYRLISLDTMEEKVYQRGVTKLAVAHRVVDKHQITNHYQRVDLQELYACKPNVDQERQTPNVPEDQMLAKLILRLPFIYKYHEHKALLANRPEFNLSKEELAAAWQAWKDRENEPKPVPPPPKTSVVTPPQKTIQTGPDFNAAYNLGRNNINILANLNKNLPARPTPDQLKQYFVPVVHANGQIRPQIVTFANPPTNSPYRHKNPMHISPSVQNSNRPPPLTFLRPSAPSGTMGGPVNRPEPTKKLNPAVLRPNPTLTNTLEGVRLLQTPTVLANTAPRNSGGIVNIPEQKNRRNSGGIVNLVEQNTSSARNAGDIVNRNEPNSSNSTKGNAGGTVKRAEQTIKSSSRRNSGGIVNRDEPSSSRRNSGGIVNRNEPSSSRRNSGGIVNRDEPSTSSSSNVSSGAIVNENKQNVSDSTKVNSSGTVNRVERNINSSARRNSGGFLNRNESSSSRRNSSSIVNRSEPNQTVLPGTPSAGTVNNSKVLRCNPASEIRFASKIGVSQFQTGSPTLSGAAQTPGGIVNRSEPQRVNVGGDVNRGGRKANPTPVRGWKNSGPAQTMGAPTGARDAQSDVRLARGRRPDISPSRPRIAMTSKLVPAHLGKRKSDLPSGGAEKKVRAVEAGEADARAGSVPNELIRSLGQSGVTIRKVANVQDVITLD